MSNDESQRATGPRGSSAMVARIVCGPRDRRRAWCCDGQSRKMLNRWIFEVQRHDLLRCAVFVDIQLGIPSASWITRSRFRAPMSACFGWRTWLFWVEWKVIRGNGLSFRNPSVTSSCEGSAGRGL